MKQHQRIGLFGGTFDPVHNAHVALARAAMAGLALDQVRWVPAGNPWQKAGTAITAAGHRAAMVGLAIEDEPRFVLDRTELDREGPSYTIDTVRALQSALPDASWWLLVGQDQFAALPTWRGYEELLSRVVLAVAPRPGAVAVRHGFAHRNVPLPPIDTAASDIRARVVAGGDISQLVPPAVARYIETHALYRAGS